MKNKIAISFFFGLSLATLSPLAHGQGSKTGYRAPYGMAGCGLGSLVIKNDSIGPQIGAAFLNMTGAQTSGISTGSSNCRLTKDDLSATEQKVFLQVNFAGLAKDAARGDGENLTAFAEILGCSDTQAFSRASQANYQSIFSSDNVDDVLANYRQAVKRDETLAKSCSRA